jgi:hypothetical protein
MKDTDARTGCGERLYRWRYFADAPTAAQPPLSPGICGGKHPTQPWKMLCNDCGRKCPNETCSMFNTNHEDEYCDLN